MHLLAVCCEKSLATIVKFMKYIGSKESVITGKNQKGVLVENTIDYFKYHWLFKIRSHPFQTKFFF